MISLQPSAVDPVERVCQWFEAATGIVVPEYRRSYVEQALSAHAASGALSEVAARLEGGDAVLADAVVDALTIPETYLFRHVGHFRELARIARQRAARGLPLHVLSAGCASGEEAWAAAAVLADAYGRSSSWSVTGIDASRARIAKAQAAVFSRWSVRQGFFGYDRYFLQRGDSRWTVREDLRTNVRFLPLCLGESYDDMGVGVFHVVFFRNVAIYWRPERAARVLQYLLRRLGGEDACLFLGPSDPLPPLPPGWRRDLVEGAPVLRAESGAARGTRTAAAFTSSTTPASPPGPRRTMPHARAEQTVPATQTEGAAAAPVAQIEAGQRRGVLPAGTVDVEAVVTQVRTLANAGRYHEALQVLAPALSGVGTAPCLHLWHGILLLNLDRPAEALIALRQAVFLDGDDPIHRRWLAAALEACGRDAETARERRNAENLERGRV